MADLPAIKARLGDTTYYILSMKAGELISRVKIPQELDGWDSMSIEERYQRDINYGRVRTQIAPYLANDDSRFFGALIVAAMNFDEEEAFEPLTEVTTKGLPRSYRVPATSMGFLVFNGGEVLVPLDGQHRLAAIEFAVTGRDERKNPIAGVPACSQLAEEDVTVILVPYKPDKARKIFTKVNRYANPTTTGQNIVTDDDDFHAVLTREIANELIGGRLAKYKSNTLTPKDSEFTTLGIIYNCNKEIITHAFPVGKIDTSHLPSIEAQRLYREKVRSVWEVLLQEVAVFVDALSDKSSAGDKRRQEIRETSLLGKPVGQECLVRAFLRLTETMGEAAACKRLNALPWTLTSKNLETWQGVLWTGGMEGKILTKQRPLATKFIAYLAGEPLDNDKKTELLAEYRSLFPESERPHRRLPKPVRVR